MLGTKRTVGFWRPKKRLLLQERALAPKRDESGQAAMSTQAIATQRARGRMAGEAKRKAQFAEQ